MKQKIIVLCIISLLNGLLYANTKDEQHFSRWLNRYQPILLKKSGLQQATIDKALDKAVFQAQVIKRDRNQLHKKISFSKYRRWVVSEKRIKAGQKAYKKHQKLLQNIAQTYQVDPEVIVALWGIESFYGRIQGNYNIIDSLLTLIFDGRRAKFFEKELIVALKMMELQHLDKASFKGSWAGAMGANQFMPSSYAAYAIDYDKDGKRDIWQNSGDIFASTANYIHKHGFIKGQPIAIELTQKIAQKIDRKKIDQKYLDQKKSVQSWSKLLSINIATKGSYKAVLKKYGKSYFLCFDNFKVIKRWNRADFFALSVGLLSTAITQ